MPAFECVTRREVRFIQRKVQMIEAETELQAIEKANACDTEAVGAMGWETAREPEVVYSQSELLINEHSIEQEPEPTELPPLPRHRH